MGLGRSNAWTDDTTPDNPYENDYTTNNFMGKYVCHEKM